MRKHRKARTTQLLTMDELLARPCKVDGLPALFHRWAEDDQALLNCNSTCQEDAEKMVQQFKAGMVAGPNFSTEVIRKTYALVEYRDGSVHMVAPELVTFTDKEGKASDVAREILEEIEGLMWDAVIGGKYPAKVINPDKYADLRKKYESEGAE